MLPQGASSCECKALLLEGEDLKKTKNQRKSVCKAGSGKLVPRKRNGLDIRHENRPMHSLTSVDCGAPYTKLVSERMSGVERKSSTEDLVNKQLQ